MKSRWLPVLVACLIMMMVAGGASYYNFTDPTSKIE